MDAVLAVITLLVYTAPLTAQTRAPHPEVNLYHLRHAYINATAEERDSIIQAIRNGISDGTITAQNGEEQIKLFELSCSMWDVEEVKGAAGEVDIATLGSYSIDAIDGVGFMTSEGVNGSTCDTTYFSTNYLPGYGGLDVFYSEWFYYPTQKIWVWQVPTNLGGDINTPNDEVGFHRNGEVFEFVRITNGIARKMIATPRTVMKSVHVASTCNTEATLLMNTYDVRGHFKSSYAFDTGYDVDIPMSAVRLEFRCCGIKEPRVFMRCQVTETTLLLEDIDVRTHVCKHEEASGTITGPPPILFGFSIYEERGSAESALKRVIKSCEALIAEGKSVHIERIPGHLGEPLTTYLAELRNRNVRVHETEARGTRTLIALR